MGGWWYGIYQHDLIEYHPLGELTDLVNRGKTLINLGINIRLQESHIMDAHFGTKLIPKIPSCSEMMLKVELTLYLLEI